MIVLLTNMSTSASFFKMVLLLIFFIFILFAAYFCTKWLAKSGFAGRKSSNISVIESQQISPGKSIVIARVGKEYVSFVLLKDHATFLTKISEEDLILADPQEIQMLSFKDVMKKVKRSQQQQKKDNEEEL